MTVGTFWTWCTGMLSYMVPERMAHTLEKMPFNVTVKVLDRMAAMEPLLAAGVLGSMTPDVAAQALAGMEPYAGAKTLNVMDHRTTAHILLQVHASS